jgi:glutamine synthetase
MPENIDKKIKDFEAEGVRRIKLALTDIDGVLRGKYISLDKFRSIAQSTGGFCDCVLGWDVNDELYDNTTFTGWHTAFPDACYRLDLTTERRLPDEGGIPFYLGEFIGDGGSGDSGDFDSHPICPRSLLRRILGRAESMGYGVNHSFEYEFFVFRETPHSIREKNFRNLTPLSPGMFGYSIIRSTWLSDLFNEFMEYCASLDIELEGLHCETGPGVWEAAIMYTSGMAAADKANLFKTFAKTFFLKKEMLATFMAKWSLDYPGQSGHVHTSLFDVKSGEPLFHDPSAPEGMSETMRMFVAGVQKYMRPFLVMSAPVINSYTRLVKGAWAPTSSTWGIDNRTTALRAILGDPKSQRMEFRVGAADGNPYLVSAAVIGAGLKGIEERLDLGDPVKGNAYAIQDDLPEELQFPSNLLDAVRIFEKSAEARELFGDEFVDHFANTRRWEVREHEKQITDWQMERYFEII